MGFVFRKSNHSGLVKKLHILTNGCPQEVIPRWEVPQHFEHSMVTAILPTFSISLSTDNLLCISAWIFRNDGSIKSIFKSSNPWVDPQKCWIAFTGDQTHWWSYKVTFGCPEIQTTFGGLIALDKLFHMYLTLLIWVSFLAFLHSR